MKKVLVLFAALVMLVLTVCGVDGKEEGIVLTMVLPENSGTQF